MAISRIVGRANHQRVDEQRIAQFVASGMLQQPMTRESHYTTHQMHAAKRA
jgi:hypothetical protein